MRVTGATRRGQKFVLVFDAQLLRNSVGLATRRAVSILGGAELDGGANRWEHGAQLGRDPYKQSGSNGEACE